MNLLSKLTLIGLAASLTGAATAQSMQIAFSPEKSRYARGEQMTVVFVARDALGRRLANTLVYAAIGWPEEGALTGGFQWTNGSGEVRIPFRVPLNPNYDNLHGMGGWFGGVPNVWAQRRIPIGR